MLGVCFHKRCSTKSLKCTTLGTASIIAILLSLPLLLLLFCCFCFTGNTYCTNWRHLHNDPLNQKTVSGTTHHQVPGSKLAQNRHAFKGNNGGGGGSHNCTRVWNKFCDLSGQKLQTWNHRIVLLTPHSSQVTFQRTSMPTLHVHSVSESSEDMFQHFAQLRISFQQMH